MASIFALGFYIQKKRFTYVIFGVMSLFFILFCINNIYFETKGNPEIGRMGIDQQIMEAWRERNCGSVRLQQPTGV